MPWKTNDQRERRWNFMQEFLRQQNSVSGLCCRHGISRKTAYKWIGRFKQFGRFGLGDRQRVAQRVHNRPSARWLQRIRRWRHRHPSWGARKLRWALERRFKGRGLPSAAAISRWLKCWGLTRRSRRAAHKGPVARRPRLTRASQPNEVWTVDFKGWFRTGDGQRLEPLTVRDLASRYVLGVVLLPRQTVAQCRPAFERIFQEHGLPLIIRVDNGSPFGATGALGLTRLSAWWVKLGIGVEFIAPGHPEQNGAHEQLHRVYAEETLNPVASTVRAQQRRSENWRRQYNHGRPHEALAMRVPAQVYRKSRRVFPGRLKPWKYETGWESRLVRSKGLICFQGRSRYIGEAFEGERVGLKWLRTGVWAVHFGPLLIGELWAQDGTPGIRAAWYRAGRQR